MAGFFKNKIVIIPASVLLVIIVILFAGYSGKISDSVNGNLSDNQQNGGLKDIDYSGFGCEPYNKMHGYSTFDILGRYYFKYFDSINYGMGTVFYNPENNMFEMFCMDKGCLHIDSECLLNVSLSYEIGYEDEIYGVDVTNSRKEILRIKNGTLTCVYKAESDIHELWGYNSYLYFNTGDGLYRTGLPDCDTTEKIMDEPVGYFYLNFDEEKMYFIDELYNLYCANHDGSDKKLLFDNLVTSPQLTEDRIYFRSNWTEEDGSRNLYLYSIKKDGSDFRLEIEEQIWRYSIYNGGIYYTTVPTEDLFINGFYCGLSTNLYYLDPATGEIVELVKDVNGEYIICNDCGKIIVEMCGEDYLNEYLDVYLEDFLEANPEAEPTMLEISGYAYYSINYDGSGLSRINYSEGLFQ